MRQDALRRDIGELEDERLGFGLCRDAALSSKSTKKCIPPAFHQHFNEIIELDSRHKHFSYMPWSLGGCCQQLGAHVW